MFYKPDKGLNLEHSDIGACKHIHIFDLSCSLLQHIRGLYI